MVRSIKTITLWFIICFGLNTTKVAAENNDSLVNKRSQKYSLVISSNGVYNYFTNKTLVNIDNPNGWVPNSRQIVYYWQYRYYDTYSFDLSVQYNKFLSRSFSLSYGLRIDQLKSVRKTFVYIDSSANLPDEKRLTVSENSFSLPISGNLYLKRFRFSLGFYTYLFGVRNTEYLYKNDPAKKYSEVGFRFTLFSHESVAFKLHKNRSVYFQLGAVQRPKFWRNYGYYNFFTAGLSFEM